MGVRGRNGLRSTTDDWHSAKCEVTQGDENSAAKEPHCNSNRAWMPTLRPVKACVQDRSVQPAPQPHVVKLDAATQEATTLEEPEPKFPPGVLVAIDIDDDEWCTNVQAWQSWTELPNHIPETDVDVEESPLLGDDVIGPDGEVYEIFYPPDCIPEEHSSFKDFDASTEADSKSTDEGTEHSFGDAAPLIPGFVSQPLCGQTSAEMCVEAMVNFMSSSAVSRYPSRAALFETVRLAASQALGLHFQRFALVGSTALCIDTPDSDLDAVVFTQSCCDVAGTEMPAPPTNLVLQRVVDRLLEQDSSLKFQLVQCTRVPVLTVLSHDGMLSLDLTVDQKLGENHILWFLNQHVNVGQCPLPLNALPVPSPDGWSQGLEVAALKCVKWWLRRRRIPVPNQGGYPSIVWTLMVLHVLRCSVFVDNVVDHENRGRTLLGALAAFFDRFADGGLAGTFLFTGGAGAEFHADSPTCQQDQGLQTCPATLSVLDPTTTCEDSIASGIEAAELVPRTSSATNLLYCYELGRAQRLSAAALASTNLASGGASDSAGGSALFELFADIGEPLNTLAVSRLYQHEAVILLRNNTLILGMLHDTVPKPGWQASFLHRQDLRSTFRINRIEIDDSGVVTQLCSPGSADWFDPTEFVCMASFSKFGVSQSMRLDAEALERWRGMQAFFPRAANVARSRRGGRSNKKGRQQAGN